MRKLRGWQIFGIVLLVVIVGVYLVISIWPSLGAQGADVLRSVLGPRVVASLETILFKVQDGIRGLEYRVGLAPAAVPWQQAGLAAATSSAPPAAIADTPQPPGQAPKTTNAPAVGAEQASSTPAPGNILPSPTPTPSPTRLPGGWVPAPIQSSGELQGAGVWTPYIIDSAGQVIAYRAFIQPDRQRPYVVAAVVAFDLPRIQLHFVLGIDEPASPGKPKRPGIIPLKDRVPGVLVAAFNGGFKAIHGHYGAMADGVVALPPRDGLGTVAIYRDGTLRIGVWGKDFRYSTDMESYRQNCPLIIQSGVIDPLVFTGSIADWGGNLDGATVTWRSGLGISQNGSTLYYLAGPYLSMPIMAQALLSAGSYQAMQLDINNYYVHFTAIRAVDQKLVAEALMPEFMRENVARYLGPFSRDFFYVTLKNGS